MASAALCDARLALGRARQAAPDTAQLAPAPVSTVRAFSDRTVAALEDLSRVAPTELQGDLQREVELERHIVSVVVDAWGDDGVDLTTRAHDAGDFDPFAFAVRDGIPSDSGPSIPFGDYSTLRVTNAFKVAVACGALDERTTESTTPPAGRLVYQKLDSKELASVRTDGSSPAAVSLAGGASAARDIAVSPDGRHLSYTATVNKRSALFVADVDGSHARMIDTLGSPACPSWSPDSTKLVIGRGRPNDSIRTVTLQGDVTTVAVETGDYSCATFLSSTTIVYERSFPESFHVELWRAGLDGSSQQRFVAVDGCGPAAFAASRDGQQLAFTTACQDLARSGLYLVDQDGANVHRIVPGYAGGLSWSPDSRFVAHSLTQPHDDRNHPRVLVSAVDGSRSWEILPSGNSWPAWLPTETA